MFVLFDYVSESIIQICIPIVQFFKSLLLSIAIIKTITIICPAYVQLHSLQRIKSTIPHTPDKLCRSIHTAERKGGTDTKFGIMIIPSLVSTEGNGATDTKFYCLFRRFPLLCVLNGKVCHNNLRFTYIFAVTKSFLT